MSVANSPLAGRRIARMNGAGNEILTLDLRGSGLDVTPAEARAIHRGEGLGYDQLMVLFDPRDAATAAFVRIYNNDGSEAGACGNGTRCVAYMLMRDGGPSELTVETRAGRLTCRRNAEFAFTVDMGAPRLGWRDIPLREAVADTTAVDLRLSGAAAALGPASVVSMGNPHAIFWTADVGAVDVAGLGALIERHPMFPDRVNVSFAQILAPDAIRLRVWERGVGITRACGSAACATLVAAARKGLTGRIATLALPGGELVIAWRASDDHVLMSGPVELEFETSLDASLFADLAA